jgi:hypothetical protein
MKLFKKFSLAVTLLITVCFCGSIISACNPDNGGSSSTALTKEQYSKAFNAVVAAIEQPASAAATSVKYSFTDSELVSTDTYPSAYLIYRSASVVVRFYNNLLANDTYTIKSSTEDCQINDTIEGASYTARLKMAYDSETSTISAYYYVETPYQDTLYVDYLVYDIVYNFETDTLENFTLCSIMGIQTTLSANNAMYFIYSDNQCKMLSATAQCYTTFSTALLAEMNSYKAAQWATELADYSTEYMTAMSQSGVYSN